MASETPTVIILLGLELSAAILDVFFKALIIEAEWLNFVHPTIDFTYSANDMRDGRVDSFIDVLNLVLIKLTFENSISTSQLGTGSNKTSCANLAKL